VGTEVALWGTVKKTKKLVLDVTKVRELLAPDLERANGGYFNSGGSGWCSSGGAMKCTYGCNTNNSSLCRER
jgi:hypothetical protein